MLCDRCKKNEATVYINEIHNGVCKKHHLCADCAKEQEEHGELGALGFNLAEILLNVGKFSETLKKHHPEKSSQSPAEKKVCPVCSWDTEKIRKNNGKLGCPECYNTFADILQDAFSRVQRGSVHLGKRPADMETSNRAALEAELEKLQKELAVFISKEEYENAAVCRDRIYAVQEAIQKVNE